LVAPIARASDVNQTSEVLGFMPHEIPVGAGTDATRVASYNSLHARRSDARVHGRRQIFNGRETVVENRKGATNMKPTLHEAKNNLGEQIRRKAIDLLGVAAILPLKDVKRRIHDDESEG
jgi:hypothetical protein